MTTEENNFILDINKLYVELKQNEIVNETVNETVNEKVNEKVTKKVTEKVTEDINLETNVIINCLECNSKNIIENYGYYVCKDCGVRYNNIIDSSQEWRYYGANDNKSGDPSRCGMPSNDLMPNNSMGSIICSNSKESVQLRKVRQIHSWNSTGYMDSTFNKNSKDMEIVAKNNGINNCIIEEAKHMYKKIAYHKYKKKAKKESIQAACIQCACKINNVPRDSIEMASMFNIKIKDMRKGSKQFGEIWSIINEENNDAISTNMVPCNSTKFLQRRCRDLKLSDEITKLCAEVCNYIEQEDYLIKHIPLSRTAGCIYFTCDVLKIAINKNDITSKCSISEVTINKCYKKLLNIKDDIIKNTSLINYK